MTMFATYYKCREDQKWYADPYWFGEDYTIMMDEDGEYIWIKFESTKKPEDILKERGIHFSNVRRDHRSSRCFRTSAGGKDRFHDSITYRFTPTATIPKPDKWYKLKDEPENQWANLPDSPGKPDG